MPMPVAASGNGCVRWVDPAQLRTRPASQTPKIATATPKIWLQPGTLPNRAETTSAETGTRLNRTEVAAGPHSVMPICQKTMASTEPISAICSFIYAMAFTLAYGRDVIKLCFRRDPDSRLHYQLRLDPEMRCEIVRKIAMPSGRAALRTEKRMHGTLKRKFPHAIIDRAVWSDQIRVKSEIYDAELTPVILDMLDRTEAKQRR